MSITLNLNQGPYYDDYSEEKDFHKVLFRPGVPVQTRELNQLQSILQKQVERFGDNIFKQGTIVNGCAFTFYEQVPYAKVKDTLADGRPTNVAGWTGYFARDNATGLNAEIIKTIDGYEAQAPDLNTLYLRYINQGDEGDLGSFSNNNTLEIYDQALGIHGVTVNVKGSNYSNSDSVVILSSLEVQDSEGNKELGLDFAVDDIINQETTNAWAKVIGVDQVSNTTAQVIRIEPLANNLSGSNTNAWLFLEGYDITCNATGATATVNGFVGSNAKATVETYANGSVKYLTMLNSGENYYVKPSVSINSTTGSGAELVAQDYVAQVQIPQLANSTGSGYGFGVGEGVVYQKGYFSRVSPQFEIVEKYHTKPDQKVVGFYTVEALVNSNADSSLLDNSTSTYNTNAPGADRLKLLPTLSVVNKSTTTANSDFFALAEFSEGRPFKQHRTTQYNQIEEEMAKRTYDAEGNYVIDPFRMGTKSVDVFANTDTHFNLVIDPGHGYVAGKRVETVKNYQATLKKGTDQITVTDARVDLVYGNYVLVNDVGGVFNFTKGEQVSLRSQQDNYLGNSGGTITAPGTEIGTARIRSMTLHSGTAGDQWAKYRLYLFDVKMNPGRNFKWVRSIYYNGTTYDGIADVAVEKDPSDDSKWIAVLKETDKSGLIRNVSEVGIANTSNLRYTYRTVKEDAIANTDGTIAITLTGDEYFPYVGALTDNEKEDIIITPLANAYASVDGTGLATTSAASRVVTGAGTLFVSEFTVGDWISIGTEFRQIDAISNNTYLRVHSNFTSTWTSNTITQAFPAFINIPFADRTDRTANVTANTLLTLDLGVAIETNTNIAVTYNAVSSNATITKTANRNRFVQIYANSNPGGVNGPWCLGVSDVFRLRSVVYTIGGIDANATPRTITDQFYVDTKQKTDMIDTSYLYKDSSSTIDPDAILIVEFDYFTRSATGPAFFSSYTIDDETILTNLGTSINTLEIPEVFADNDKYWDLRDCVDFRPLSANTIVPTTNALSAPVDPTAPAESVKFNNDNKKFPAPQGDMEISYKFYKGRVDSVFLTSNGDFLISNNSAVSGRSAKELLLGYVHIPPYPSLPSSLNAYIREILNTRTYSYEHSSIRSRNFSIKLEQSQYQYRPYRMEDIGKLEKRIENLEYYARVSLLEQELLKANIPSSISSNINRYKYGFFVDTFEDYRHSDTGNPNYSATVFEYKLHPPKEDIVINFEYDLTHTNTANFVVGEQAGPIWEEVTLISQTNATDGPVDRVATAGELNDDSGSITYTDVTEFDSKCVIKTQRNNQILVTDYDNYRFTNVSDADTYKVTLYFDVFEYQAEKTRSPRYGTWFEIYQGSTLVATTNQAKNLTAQDKTFLNSIEAFNSRDRRDYTTWFNSTNFTKPRANREMLGAGKIEFNYNRSAGRNFQVRTGKGPKSYIYTLCFPTDVYVVSNTNTTLTTNQRTCRRPIVIQQDTDVRYVGNPVFNAPPSTIAEDGNEIFCTTAGTDVKVEGTTQDYYQARICLNSSGKIKIDYDAPGTVNDIYSNQYYNDLQSLQSYAPDGINLRSPTFSIAIGNLTLRQGQLTADGITGYSAPTWWPTS